MSSTGQRNECRSREQWRVLDTITVTPALHTVEFYEVSSGFLFVFSV